jgi:ABC-type nitrate/sulfonate/bicarbonate transport system ATPase subunit
MNEGSGSTDRGGRGSASGPAIAVHGLTKSFEEGRIPALRGVEMEIGSGEFVAITGPSG